MIQLSFSTLNELINEPHTWLCKQMGLERETTWQMQAGTDIHRIVQDHVSGVKKDDRLKHITCEFPIVETKRMDEATHFVFEFNKDFSVHGYVDGLNLESKQILEIKTSSKPWGLKKFYDLMQWRVYGLAHLNFKEVVLITSDRDLTNVKTFSVELTAEELQKGQAWIQQGIDIIESGNFGYKGNGKSRWCNYKNCPFCGV